MTIHTGQFYWLFVLMGGRAVLGTLVFSPFLPKSTFAIGHRMLGVFRFEVIEIMSL